MIKNILGAKLENVKTIKKQLKNMTSGELKTLTEQLKKEITLYLTEGNEYYKLSEEVIIPKKKGMITENTLLEDYTGPTYNNEYYRIVTNFFTVLQLELEEKNVDYEIEGNPVPDFPVFVKGI